jgi:uncharacterized membrane protein (UPF0127 family)
VARLPNFLEGWQPGADAWLIHEDRVCASLEIAFRHTDRRRGLRGRAAIDAALLLVHTRSVHTFGVPFEFDLFFCDTDLLVLEAFTIPPRRCTLPRLAQRHVIEAPRGAIDRWGVKLGDRFEVRF